MTSVPPMDYSNFIPIISFQICWVGIFLISTWVVSAFPQHTEIWDVVQQILGMTQPEKWPRKMVGNTENREVGK